PVEKDPHYLRPQRELFIWPLAFAWLSLALIGWIRCYRN
ncbi:MAG: BatB protein, partial [Methylococcaceae bacterium]|nr:BatB protein [Methylococcaceae bacterium]